MYCLADFETVQALPDVLSVPMLSKAIGLSASRTYEFLDEERIPYLSLDKRKIIFKEHLIQGLSGKRVYTEISNLSVIKYLPNVFSPVWLKPVLGISNGYAYTLIRTPGFPVVFTRNRMHISKQGFIQWIKANEKYI